MLCAPQQRAFERERRNQLRRIGIAVVVRRHWNSSAKPVYARYWSAVDLIVPQINRAEVQQPLELLRIVGNLFHIPAKINKVSPGDSKHYFPVDDIIIMHCNVSEPHGLSHGFAGGC